MSSDRMDALEMAKLIAGEHGLFIATVTEVERKSRQSYVAFVLYRKAPTGGNPFKIPKPERIARRRSPADMLALVKETVGINTTGRPEKQSPPGGRGPAG